MSTKDFTMMDTARKTMTMMDSTMTGTMRRADLADMVLSTAVIMEV
jgi:hypothetical protein